MALFKLNSDHLEPLERTYFHVEGVKERNDLQRVLRDKPEAIEPGLSIVAEEYGNWEESRRRIDLLGLDGDGNLVVIELKRNEDTFMDLQAIRYAALVSPLRFNDLVEAHQDYMSSRKIDGDSRSRLLSILSEEPDDEFEVGSKPRIILVAAQFSTELTTAVIWLVDQGLDIKCVQVSPYKLGDELLVDFQQVIPLPQASDYQVKIRGKAEAARVAQQTRQRKELTRTVLVRAGLIKPGTVITLLSSFPSPGADPIEAGAPNRRAKFAQDGYNVIWEEDGKQYSLSGLCGHMRDEHGFRFPSPSNGYLYWSLEGSDEDLSTLAERYRVTPNLEQPAR